jgi:hypothetical protein
MSRPTYPCYSWPATGCDSYFNDSYRYNGTNEYHKLTFKKRKKKVHESNFHITRYLRPRALLAIPPHLNDSVIVTTIPGQKIKNALITYGNTANNFAIL